MFKKNKKVVLTETTCHEIECLRLAIEVLLGKQIRFKQLDLNTRKGQIIVGEEIQDFSYHFVAEDAFNFSLGVYKYYWFAVICKPWEARVHSLVRSFNRERNVIWIGNSAINRRKEPIVSHNII